MLVACTLASTPLPLCWIWLTNIKAVYLTLPFIHIIVGFTIGGISVALNTLVYKVTPSIGRSVQFAIYSIIVVLGAAPFPAIGGHLPDWANAVGIHLGLRITFFTSILFIGAATLAAWFIREPGAQRTRVLVRQLPTHLRKPETLTGA